MILLDGAGKEMISAMAKRRLSKAIEVKVAKGCTNHMQIGDEVLIYCEGPYKWVGQYRVIDFSSNITYVEVPGPSQSLPLERMKKYLRNDNIIPDGTILEEKSSQRAAYAKLPYQLWEEHRNRTVRNKKKLIVDGQSNGRDAKYCWAIIT